MTLYDLGKAAADALKDGDSAVAQAMLVAVALAYYNGSMYGWERG